MSQCSDINIEYGIETNYRDITTLALKRCVEHNTLFIPNNDCTRAGIFGDHLYGTVKHIRITKNGHSTIYPDSEQIKLDVSDVDLSNLQPSKNTRSWYNYDLTDPIERLESIHRNIRFTGGNIREEYPEQLMAVMFLSKDAKVLELGSNIGRNTLTIATILSDQNNLVTLECSLESCRVLRYNMELNDYKFHIEDSALSYRKLIQRGWTTIPSDLLLPGYVPVKSITFQELEDKYKIEFDTIVADCEGALYYILLDYPDMLNNIKTVILENDYYNINHKNSIDKVFMDKGFARVYVKGGGWGPCADYFFEVWQKILVG